MKFIHVLTVPMSLAALTVMGGADGCMEDQAATCQPRLQQMQFVGYEGCQYVEFCDGARATKYTSRSAGVAGYQLGVEALKTYALPEDKSTYLNAWLYINQAGQVCARPPDQSLIDQGAPIDKVVKVTVTLTAMSAAGVEGGTIEHDIQVAVQTLDFAPAVSNATHQVQLGDRKVAVFVQPTAVTELRLQANLTQTPSAGTISYQLPEMPATMTTVPAANAEAIVSVSQGIAVGDGATVKATLEADGETIEREVDLRVVARSDDPIVDVRPTDVSNCANFRCAETRYRRACFTTAESLPSIDGTQGRISWGEPAVLTREGAAILSASAQVTSDNMNSNFLLCYTNDIGVVRVRGTARRLTDMTTVSYDYSFDTTSR